MKKIKYYYNTNTLRYEKLVTPFRVKLLRIFGFVSAALVTSAIIVTLYTKFFPKAADKEPKDALVYQNPTTKQRLTYFINTACPEELTEEHRRLLSTADTLVLIGHDPVLLDMLPHIHLITNLHTTYHRTLCDPDRMKAYLATHPDRIASLVQIRETQAYEHWTDTVPPREHMNVVSLATWEELEASALYKQQLYHMT